MSRTKALHHGLACLALMASLATPAVAADPAAGVDGLTAVKSKRVDKAYLRPGADFRPYTAVMLEPVTVAFARNWQSDYNNSVRDLGRRISDDDAAKLLEEARAGFAKVFAERFAKAGYRIADASGPDVLRVGASVADIRVNAPDVQAPGRGRSYAREAGSAALTLEARDSKTGTLLGRSIDRRDIGDTGQMMWQRNSVTNRADFERAFTSWSDAAVKALSDLKTNAAAAAPH